ncbi:MAG: D-alanine--D-alanine ligase [Thermoanaerobaculales bacterium]|jgi:D-alanine-D-alanine ligase|nr:D-alanine--D-alanine ligase [Thermoanaerobaculales bacterium]
MGSAGGRRRLRVALVFGGRSGEHDVSVVSARSVSRALDRERYEVLPMAIDRAGLWADPETSERVLAGSADRADGVLGFSGRQPLDPRLVEGALDLAFPVLHGPYGEDGTIQGLFQILGLPFVGCDTAASAVCMDKIFCKRMLAHAGLPTPPWVELDRERWAADRGRITAHCLGLGLPLFVKPARLGSSVGITKVKHGDELAAAVEEALGHGERALVERGVDAREIEVAVLGGSPPRASLPGEVVPGREFYDYADKYLDSSCRLLAPAPLDAATTARVQELALAVFQLLGCAGMARVDLFLARQGSELWVNEVNTIPGFTSISMYPRLWELSGLPYPELLDALIRLALEREGRSP